MLRNAFIILAQFCDSINSICSTKAGFTFSFFTILGTVLVGHNTVLYSIALCLIFDFVIELWSSIKYKRFKLTELLERTISKCLAYFGSVALVLYVEHSIPLIADSTILNGSILGALICVTELWSMMGGMLSINPNIPGLRLLRKLLKSEIAKKIGISEQEFEETIKQETIKQ